MTSHEGCAEMGEYSIPMDTDTADVVYSLVPDVLLLHKAIVLFR
jgi:hypothetical protein